MRPCRLLVGALYIVSAFGQGGFNGPGQYEITNIKSGKVLDLDRNDQTTVIQFSSRGTDNQTWYIEPANGGAYFIRNGMNGNALTATRESNAAQVQGLPFRGDPSQQWTIENGKDGNAMLVSQGGRTLDVPDGTDRDGVRIQLYDRNGDSNQRFSLRQVSGRSGGRFNQPSWRGGQNGGGPTINCSSDDGRRHYCGADTRNGITLTRQISGSPCTQGQTWGSDDRGIWVDRGCRAEFQAGGGGGGGGGRSGGFYRGSSDAGSVTCASDDGGRHYCNVDTNGGVQLTRQISGSPCTQGRTWGYDDRGIWVDRGCRAEFQTGGGGGGGGLNRGGNAGIITCSSDDGGRHYCNANTNGGVQLTRQISGSACVQGQTWGFDNRGIWVDRGCRAEFQIGSGRYRR